MTQKIKNNINLQGSLDEQIDLLLSRASNIKEILDKTGMSVAENLGIEYIEAPIKQKERAKEKILAEYNGDALRLEDTARCSFLCQNYEQMLTVSEAMGESFEILLTENSMETPIEIYDGYRRILLLIRINDYVAEIQIMLNSIYDAKLKSRHLFLERRAITAKAEIEERGYTPEETKQLLRLKKESVLLYDDTVNKYNEETAGTKLKLYKDCYDINKLFY